MDRTRRLPDAELTVMQAVWDCGAPAARAEIEARLPPERHMAATTLLTLLSRLAERGFVRADKAGRRRALHRAREPEGISSRAEPELP